MFKDHRIVNLLKILTVFITTIILFWKNKSSSDMKQGSMDDPQSTISLVKRFNRMNNPTNEESTQNNKHDDDQNLTSEPEASNDVLFTRLSDMFGDNIYH